MIYLCDCGNTEFVLEDRDGKPALAVGEKFSAVGELQICSNRFCARPMSQAVALQLSCPGCGYGHFIKDQVINEIQTLICAHCAERWELDRLKMQAVIHAYEAGRINGLQPTSPSFGQALNGGQSFLQQGKEV